ncbi:twin-arginine translocation pathway signal protein [Siccirubricoccus sp. KC 17139]|uniref:Twin-arginine translocation pathway signal protein n=1 Tax=Siccirubricoccus soli TaxID=2899147 RepID=A0ABT1D3R1_9PROT|nr:tripartite tricarboxylate transporter substrate-binding protein [Siccirubricoccus soli]MCO6416571.1 twin-arginine translocation pathway signal protein [Siccirubricoccus soli]MCP2682706.1 tripartite tricarboxylate transporter substrate-binding protein [Siccirubricoccus soli]
MSPVPRRAGLALALAPGLPRPGRGQPGWPSRPIRILVAWPAGGSTDAVMRLLAGPMQAALGQPVVIENRAGASGSIGAAAAAQSAPDGYTVLGDASSQAANPSLLRGLAFDYATAFAPVTQLCVAPALLLVRAEDGPRDLAGLLARLRQGGGTYSSSGIGTAVHLAMAALLRQAGVAATHVPYRGSPQQVQAVLAGEVLTTFCTVPAAAGLVRDGRLRALAVSSARRLAAFPEVPTVAEQGFPGYAVTEWLALFVPAGTPEPAIARLAQAAQVGLADPAVQARLELLGMEAAAAGPAALGAFVAEQRMKLAEVIRAEGIRLE